MNAENKKQLNVRIPVELFEKVTQSDKPQVDVATEALELYFNKAINNDSNSITNDSNLNKPEFNGYIQSLEQQNSLLKDQIADLRANNGKLMTLLNQEQALHMQTQRLLPPAPEKKWWRFWK